MANSPGVSGDPGSDLGVTERVVSAPRNSSRYTVGLLRKEAWIWGATRF